MPIYIHDYNHICKECNIPYLQKKDSSRDRPQQWLFCCGCGSRMKRWQLEAIT